jgi:hypothetical protein
MHMLLQLAAHATLSSLRRTSSHAHIPAHTSAMHTSNLRILSLIPGVIIAHFGKNVKPPGWWFRQHRMIQTTGLLCGIIGMVIGFVVRRSSRPDADFNYSPLHPSLLSLPPAPHPAPASPHPDIDG